MKTKRVYALYRVSTLGQVEKDDIPMQKQYCREFAANQGWTILKEYTEKGVSGYKKSAKERDAIQHIQQAAVEQRFDILLVFMFDRLGRRDDETPFVVEWFDRQGIEVWSAMEGQQRFDTHVDKLMNYIRYWQASGESLKTSMRTKTRLSQLTEEGHYTGGSVPYGYRLVDLGRTNKRGKPVYDLAVAEDEAEIVRLIFHKYVYEGYGAQRLCHYLHEQGLSGRTGHGFPNTTINRILKNVMYTGVIKNGEAQSEPIEALQIIEPELFRQAQKIMTERTLPHSEVPRNTKSKALLVGRIFCGHCGNRLTLTTSGQRIIREGGGVHYASRIRYQCHYKVRHPGECDGQSGYGVPKLDGIVEEVIRMKLAQLKAASETELVSVQQERELDLAKARRKLAMEEVARRQQEIADYRREVIKVIRGESHLTEDLLRSVMEEAASALHDAEENQRAAENAVRELEESSTALQQEYSRILTWADLYDQSSFEAKKMIVQQLIKAVYVHRNYDIDIVFNVSFEEFQQCRIAGDCVGA